MGGIAKTESGKSRKVGSTFTKTIEQGPNKGDIVTFKVAPSGKPYPIRVVKDKGGDSTLKNNPGVKFGEIMRKFKQGKLKNAKGQTVTNFNHALEMADREEKGK